MNYATLEDAKKTGCVGCQFQGRNGVVGTILKDLSLHGKAQAELTCEVTGCTEIHIRESSDWHQASKCRKHAKKKYKKKPLTHPEAMVAALSLIVPPQQSSE